jgi:hypothetical protein
MVRVLALIKRFRCLFWSAAAEGGMGDAVLGLPPT